MSAYRRILVAVDGSPPSARGLKEAIRLAGSQRAALVLFHYVNEYYPVGLPTSADLLPAMKDAGRKILDRAKALADRAGIRSKTVMREGLGGMVADAIVAEAKKQGADLIVLGTHGRRGLKRIVMGSDAEQVLRASKVPVLLVRASA